uniref:3',5'-cyclic-AMP phosphodiesterase n=1 Tax=Sinocyclocheilus grahami TaxID=75366 RepID=A0A672SRD6_SINGR
MDRTYAVDTGHRPGLKKSRMSWPSSFQGFRRWVCGILKRANVLPNNPRRPVLYSSECTQTSRPFGKSIHRGIASTSMTLCFTLLLKVLASLRTVRNNFAALTNLQQDRTSNKRSPMCNQPPLSKASFTGEIVSFAFYTISEMQQ